MTSSVLAARALWIDDDGYDDGSAGDIIIVVRVVFGVVVASTRARPGKSGEADKESVVCGDVSFDDDDEDDAGCNENGGYGTTTTRRRCETHTMFEGARFRWTIPTGRRARPEVDFATRKGSE